ncbi:hypothetical protein BofuT4_uP092210.1 [Botrytis cinerea T4]|uniref:Uncharacterized protein n=1 Tax=Botryotinia fuckeliana (strain T4) TaxID=999810 RepID=G2YER4_BOTF4|nr:hypothetical protein BofuT4_uP092210.1 [Botrytis cinerea T4]
MPIIVFTVHQYHLVVINIAFATFAILRNPSGHSPSRDYRGNVEAITNRNCSVKLDSENFVMVVENLEI